MHQGTFGRAGFLHERTQGVGAVGVAGGSGHQVGLQADVVEDIVGREVGCDCWVGRGGRVDTGERGADGRGECGIGAARAQFGLPQREAFRRQELHGQRAAFLVLAE